MKTPAIIECSEAMMGAVAEQQGRLIKENRSKTYIPVNLLEPLDCQIRGLDPVAVEPVLAIFWECTSYIDLNFSQIHLVYNFQE